MSRCGARYHSSTSDADDKLADELRALAARHPRFGYRRAHALLRRAGQMVNHKRVWRVWRAAGLVLPRRRRSRRLQPSSATPPRQATRPNEVWTDDFVHDACLTGRKLKLLTVVDEFTRESLCVATRTSIKSQAVIEVLARLTRERAIPAYMRSDNGAEFIARQVKVWLGSKEIQTLYIEPGSRWQNAKGESFNGRLRDECLNMECFNNPQEAQVVTESWRKYYNEERPHSSLDYQTPMEFRRGYEQQQKRQLSIQRI